MTLTTFALVFIAIFSVVSMMIGYIALTLEKRHDK